MTKLSDYSGFNIHKLLLEGDSATGKTTALASLVNENYKLRIWDWDNGLGGLTKQIMLRCPDKIDNVEFVTLRDKYRSTELGPMLDGTPTAMSTGAKLCDKWTDGTAPTKWGKDYIAVFDSLTHWSRAAFNWALMMSSHLDYVEGVNVKGGPDPRNVIYIAQRAIAGQLANITAESFNTNVIVISHIKYTERDFSPTKGYPLSIGSALGPEILTFFNNHVVSFETSIESGSIKRRIRTQSTSLLDLRTSATISSVDGTLDAYDGLAKIFKRS